MKTVFIVLIFIFLSACTPSPQEIALPPNPTSTAPIDTPRPKPTLTTQIDTQPTPPPTSAPWSTATPTPTSTMTPTPTATFIPLPTKEVILQFGFLNGDGGSYMGVDFGSYTPSLILYTDGQMIITKSEDHAWWFEETKLTIPQICSLLSQIKNTGFFDFPSNQSKKEDSPIYKFDATAQFSAGGPGYMIQVNGNPHNQLEFYELYTPYLVPKAKRALDLFKNYSSPNKLTAYQPTYLLLWVEKGLGYSIYETPAPTPQIWPTNLPPLEVLEKTGYRHYDDRLSLVFLEGDLVKPVFELFGNRQIDKLYTTEHATYFVIPRPLLPHDTLDEVSPYPYHDKKFDLPFKCNQ